MSSRKLKRRGLYAIRLKPVNSIIDTYSLWKFVRVKQVNDKEEICQMCHHQFVRDSYCILMNCESLHIQCYIQTSNWKKFLIPSSSNELDGFDLLLISQQQEIRNIFWPNQIKMELRSKLKLKKYFLNDMNQTQLRLELYKRDISPYQYSHTNMKRTISRQEMIEKLAIYLTNEKCKKTYNLIITGYCHEFERDQNIYFPVYLQQIIINFYPMILK